MKAKKIPKRQIGI